mmetsp:Transcript_2268/g.3003  ORF Transcript_2268/g.3003 Transcript_2268/m.3003 type:complete len:384 (-) Transcript_2268:48-1199(-)
MLPKVNKISPTVHLRSNARSLNTKVRINKFSTQTNQVPTKHVAEPMSLKELNKLREQDDSEDVHLKATASGGAVVTVFGATGFIGRYVVNRLARAGAQVVVPFRGEEKSYNHLKVTGDVGQIIPIPFSIRDQNMIDRAMSHSNMVVNLIGRDTRTRNFSLEESNIISAQKIAAGARKRGIARLVHLSAVGASSDSPSAWARSKAESEKVVRQEFPDATILRCAPVYGTEDRLLNAYGYTARVFPWVPLLVNPHSKFQPIWVQDVAVAVERSLTRFGAVGKTFELGGPRTFTWEEFVNDIIITGSGQPKPVLKVPKWIGRHVAGLNSILSRRSVWNQDQIEYFEKDVVVDGAKKHTRTIGNLPRRSRRNNTRGIQSSFAVQTKS